MLPAEIVTFLKAARSIYALSRDDIAVALEALNDAEYRAAIQAFKEAKLSSTPSREMEMGITLLRDVYEKSLVGLKRTIWITIPESWFGPPAPLRAGLRAVSTALLIAAYYHSAQEKQLATEWIARVRVSYGAYQKKYVENYASGYPFAVAMAKADKRHEDMEELLVAIDAFIATLV